MEKIYTRITRPVSLTSEEWNIVLEGLSDAQISGRFTKEQEEIAKRAYHAVRDSIVHRGEG